MTKRYIQQTNIIEVPNRVELVQAFKDSTALETATMVSWVTFKKRVNKGIVEYSINGTIVSGRGFYTSLENDKLLFPDDNKTYGLEVI
jgi:hypothetical protein